MKNNILINFFFSILLLKYIVNEKECELIQLKINDEEKLNIKNESYCFFTNIINDTEKKPITFFINGSEADISYKLLKSDKSDYIKEESKNTFVNKVNLIEIENNKNFISIFKTNNNQKVLLLKIKNLDKNPFSILRKNISSLNPYDEAFFFKSNEEDKFLFFGLDSYLKKYDIFMFLSNIITDKFIYYEINEKDNSISPLIKKKSSYLFINGKPKIRYIYILNNKDEVNFAFYTKLFQKNKFSLNKDINTNNNIELDGYYQPEKYYLFDFTDKDIEQYIFYNKKYGNFSSYYIELNGCNNLSNIFDNITQMNLFESPIYINKNKDYLSLFYFNLTNNHYSMLDLINLEVNNNLYKGEISYIIVPNTGAKNISIQENIKILFECIYCVNITILNITHNNSKELEMINDKIMIDNAKGEYSFESKSEKICVIKVKYGEIEDKENKTIEESDGIKIKNEVFLEIPKKEEKYHYLILLENVSYKQYYDYNDEKDFYFYCKDNYIKAYNSTNINYVEINSNSNIFLEKMIYFIELKGNGNNSSYSVINVKKGNNLTNKTFLLEKFTEYTFHNDLNYNTISIQILDGFSDNSFIKIVNDIFKIDEYNTFQIIKLNKNDNLTILNINSDLLVRINYINDIDFYDYFDLVNKVKMYNVSLNSYDKKISIEFDHFIKDKRINYTIHIFNKTIINNDSYELNLYNNYGKIDLKNFTFVEDSNDDNFKKESDISKRNLNFKFFAIDIESGYLKNYKLNNYEYIQIKSKKWAIILIIGIIVFILLIVVIYNLLKRQNNNSYSSSDIEEQILK